MKKKALTKSAIVAGAAVLIAGGSYGGYHLVKSNEATIFEDSMHHVARVIDGDTITIERQGSEDVRVRLLGIDAPEQDTCYFEESKAALKKLVEGKDIRIEKDISGTDKYDRYLRYVYLPSEKPEDDDLFVDYWLVEQGYARVLSIAPDTRYRDLLARAESEARAKKRGMWSAACKYLSEYKTTATLRESASTPSNPSCIIKGNISEKSYGKEYFVEGCPNYNRVKVDTRKGEAFFCSEAAAQKAGYKKSASCATTFGASK